MKIVINPPKNPHQAPWIHHQIINPAATCDPGTIRFIQAHGHFCSEGPGAKSSPWEERSEHVEFVEWHRNNMILDDVIWFYHLVI